MVVWAHDKNRNQAFNKSTRGYMTTETKSTNKGPQTMSNDKDDEYVAIPNEEIVRFKDVFANIIKENPLLTQEEEFALAKIIHNSQYPEKAQQAREKLFNSNIRLVFKIAHSSRYRSTLEFHDLFSAGINGLIIAVDKFDPESYTNKFGTYAYSWIKVYIDRAVRSSRHTVHIPTNILEKYVQYMIMTKDNPDITDQEAMKIMGVSDLALEKIKSVSSTQSFSINAEISNGEGSTSTYEDIIADQKGISADEIVADNDEHDYKTEVLHESIAELSEIQRDVIRSRHLSPENSTLSAIAERHHLSKERIRQIEKKALGRLKKKISYKMSMRQFTGA